MIARDDIQIVDICAPGFMHAEIAIAALAAGKHVLVEKPLANTLAEAEAMAEAARTAQDEGVQSMIGFNYRRVPALALARELIAEGRLGTVRHVRAAYLQDWLVDPDVAHDLAAEQGHRRVRGAGRHRLATRSTRCCSSWASRSPRSPAGCTPSPRSARAPPGSEEVTVDDAAWATLTLASGAIASVEVSRVATGQKNSLKLEIYGDKGALLFDLEDLNELGFLDATLPVREQGFRRILVNEPEHPYLEAWWPQGHVIGWEHTFTHEIRDFLVAVGTGTQPSPSFEDGLTVQRILAAVEESAAAKSSLIQLTPSARTTQTTTEGA